MAHGLKALILVGGWGTRLRPLSLSTPKPLVPFANAAMLELQVRSLVEAGVNEIIMAVNYQPQVMTAALQPLEKRYNVKITFSREEEPLGTAGPLALARALLAAEDNRPFFVLNADVVCEFPFADLLAFHKRHGREGTIMVTRVDDPSKYGVVVAPEDGCIERFVEKPKEFVSNRINAGIYVFQPSILNRIQPRPTSIEKEIFPVMASEKQLYCMDLHGFWMDIGQPKDYLLGLALYLAHVKRTAPDRLASGKSFHGNVLMEPTAKVGADCMIGPNVTIGANVVIGDGVRLRDVALFDGVQVRDHAWIRQSIVGWNSSVGRWVRMENISVLGEDVHIDDELFINGGRILPHKTISESVPEPTVIM